MRLKIKGSPEVIVPGRGASSAAWHGTHTTLHGTHGSLWCGVPRKALRVSRICTARLANPSSGRMRTASRTEILAPA